MTSFNLDEALWSKIEQAAEANQQTVSDYLNSNFVDIAQRREVEKSLAHAAAIIQASDDAIIGKDLDGKVISWNPAAERMYGYTAAEMIGNSISIIVPIERKHEVKAIVHRIRQGKSVDHYETERLAKDGRTIMISLTTSPIRDEGGEIIGAAVIARDITSKKQIEKALHAHESRLRLITDNMSDMIIHTDTKGIVRYASPSALNLRGKTPDQLINSHFIIWMDLVYAEDREGIKEKFQKRMKTGEGPRVGIFRRQSPTGKIYWYEYTASDSRDKNGSLIGFTFVIRNVSQRMEAVLALQESEGRLRQAMNVGRLGIWEWDIGTDRTIWLGDIYRMYGIEPDEFTGKAADYLEYTLIDDRVMQQENITKAFKHGITEKELIEGRGDIVYEPKQFRILRPDGSICHVQGDAIAIVDDRGERVRMIGVVQDVTERETTMDALHRSEERYRMVSELTSDFAYAVRVNSDGSLHFDWMTEAFSRITGYALDNLEDIFEKKLIYGKDLVLYQQALAKVLEGESSKLDLRIVTADGSIRWLRTRNLPIWDEKEGRTTYIYGAAQDITEQRSVESAMQQAQKLESLGVMAGSVAHDFNNLLTSILTNATLIQLKLDRHLPVDNYVESIVEAVERAASITRQLLAYSGKGRFEVTAIDLNEEIQSNLKLLETTIPKNIRLVFNPMPGLPLIEGDMGQIQQILMNLILNGADAYNGRSGHVEINTQTVVLGKSEAERWVRKGYNVEPGRYICLQVVDEGDGMAEGTVANIFDPFFTTKETGRGLGLAAVQGIIRGHHGALLVHSEINAGTRFDVLLPASKEDRVVPLINQESPTVERTEAFILIVDDEDDVRVAISDALTFLGYRVLLAENGQEALAKYQQYGKEIGLILLDITMPVLTGMETLALLEQKQLASPVIFMSGYEEKRLDAFKQSEQVVGFLKKPFRLEILMSTIKSAFKQGTAVETRLHT